MKGFQIFAFLFVVGHCAQAAGPVKAFCLEELRHRYGNNTAAIHRSYSKTGESACFPLKTHVAKCLDKTLFAAIRIYDPAQLKDKTITPSVTVSDLITGLQNYFAVDKLPGFRDFLQRCSHNGGERFSYRRVISVGDFSHRCVCDLGNDYKCLAYEHVGSTFHCGEVEELSKILYENDE
jgi:hypothetical protein